MLTAKRIPCITAKDLQEDLMKAGTNVSVQTIASKDFMLRNLAALNS